MLLPLLLSSLSAVPAPAWGTAGAVLGSLTTGLSGRLIHRRNEAADTALKRAQERLSDEQREREQLEAIIAVNTDIRADYARLREELSAVNDKITDVQADTQQHRVINLQLLTMVKTIRAQNTALQSRVAELTTQLTDLQDLLVARGGEIERLREEVEARPARCAECPLRASDAGPVGVAGDD